jgi:hypothetical protein
MRKYLLLAVALMLYLETLVVAGVAISDKGYTFSFQINSETADGVLAEKPGVWRLEKQERILTAQLLDKEGQQVLTMPVYCGPAMNGKYAVAWMLERVFEQAQGRDGYRAILAINGRRLAEKVISPLALNTTDAEPSGKLEAAKEHGRVLKTVEVKRLCGQSFCLPWPSTEKEVLRVENPAVVLILRKGSGKGSPLLGCFNRAINAPAFTGNGFDWELELTQDGINTRLTADEFEYDPISVQDIEGGQQFTVRWKHPHFAVTGNFTLRGSRLESQLAVEVLEEQGILQRITFPIWRLHKMPGKNTAVLPLFSGVEFANPTDNLSQSAIWPNGHSSMQFAALYNDEGQGVYLGREDASGETKEQTFTGCGGILEALWKVGVARGQTKIELPGKAVLEFYQGNWFEAGQIYKRFAATTPWWVAEIPRKGTPQWFMENPMWICGIPIDTGLPTYRWCQEYFETPVAIIAGLLLTKHGNWRYGPEYVVKDFALPSLKQMQEEGIRVFTYFNGRLCFADKTADEENNYTEKWLPHTAKNEDGKPYGAVYGAQGYHTVMCPGSPVWQEHLLKNMEMFAAAKMAGVYHDQLPCSTAYSCFDENHGHPVNDPQSWVTKGHWKTYGKIMGEFRKQHPELAHTGEDASDAFLSCLDGFMVWRFGRAGHVPLFQSIYAPRIQFVGRGGDVHALQGTYEAFFPKYGEQLIFGEQIGWNGLEEIRYPSPRRSFLKKLSLLRYAIASFMNAAEMQKPLTFAEPPETMTTMWGVDDIHKCTTDKILHSVWKHKDGRGLVMFLNTVAEEQTVRPQLSLKSSQLVVLREGATSPQIRKDVPTQVSLPAYGAEFWLLTDSDGTTDELVGRVFHAMQKSVRVFEDNQGLLINQSPDFSKSEMLNAVKAPLYARDACWLLRAFRATGGNLGYHPNPGRKMNENWIAARDGAVVYFGKAYVGTAPDSVEFELATDQKGVVVQLIDITENAPDAVLAEVRPDPGPWFEFRKFRVPFLRNVDGHRAVVMQFSGGNCNLRSWQVIQKPDTQ